MTNGFNEIIRCADNRSAASGDHVHQFPLVFNMLRTGSAKSPHVVFVVPPLQTINGLIASLFARFGEVETQHHAPVTTIDILSVFDSRLFSEGPLRWQCSKTSSAIRSNREDSTSVLAGQLHARGGQS